MALAASAAGQNDFVRPSTPMPAGRAFHGSATLGDWLYVFGGSSTFATGGANAAAGERKDSGAMKARILPDGSTTAWEPTTPLPEPRHYIANSTLVLNDVVYIVGGSDATSGGRKLDNALFARPLADGTLTPWAASKSFGEGLSTITAVTTPGHIHVIGGLRNDDQPTDAVRSNALNPDGSMGDWTAGLPLPTPLWYHHAGVAGGRVWVWGGLPHGDAPNGPRNPSDRVYSSPILATGKLGAWREEPVRLPAGMYSAASAVAGPYLISFGPRYQDGVQSGDIVWSYVSPQGMAPWQRTATTLPHRLYHSVATNYRLGTINVLGGRTDRGAAMTPSSTILALSPAARAMAEQSWFAANPSRTPAPETTVAAVQLPTSGEVRSVGLSYMAEERLAAGAMPGFASVAQARRKAAERRMPLVMYFNMRNAPPCERQKPELLKPQFAAMDSIASFAWVDTSEHPQLAQQLGVYRVPTWVFYDRAGAEVVGARNVGTMPSEQIARTILGIK